MEKQLKELFYENRKGLDMLIGLYKSFKNEFYKEQRGYIKGYYEQIRSKTKIGKWWRYSYGRVLGIYCYGEEKGHRIGIECVFENETFENPLGMFHIYVASWAEPHFRPYEQAIEKAFPNKKDRGTEKREFRLVKAFTPEGNQEAIISTLEKTYKTLTDIIKNHK